MHNTPRLLDALFTSRLQGVLAAAFLRPQRQWYLSDLAADLGTRPSSLQRPLARLVDSGILLRHKDGNRVYYRPDPDCPIYTELASILAKTAGVAHQLRRALSPLASRIHLAFIHGSIAVADERSDSDIDLIIVADLPSADLALALRPLHDRLGRQINFTRYAPSEFISKLSSRHHFLSSVLRKPRIVLLGDERLLQTTSRAKSHRSRAHRQTGT